MFSKYFSIIFFFITFSVFLTNDICPSTANYIDKNCETEIVSIVKDAIEETDWLYAKSQWEMEQFLGNYYTGALLKVINEAAWDFISLPTDWNYTVKTKNIFILQLTEENACVRAYFIEIEIFSGEEFFNVIDYYLAKTEKGWRITDYQRMQQ